MATTLRFQFDPDQPHQTGAIASVVQLFDGRPRGPAAAAFALRDEIVPNLPPDQDGLDEDLLFANLRDIQTRNGLPIAPRLDIEEGFGLEGTGDASRRFPSFTTEMETGTGKTYVYLRTIYELRREYGLRKFVIVVPSIAIYEGVIKSFEIMNGHFRSLYHNEVIGLVQYDGGQLGKLRAFATDTGGMVLLITIDAFNRLNNNLYKPSEKLPGERLPYQYIQQTRPIVILDEPQSIDNTETARKAIRTLHPLFALRYSATHRVHPNLLYRLSPVDAYRQGLVKKIEVIGLRELSIANESFLILEEVTSDLRARVRTTFHEKGVAKEGTAVLGKRDDLFAKTRHPDHRDGFKVAEINRQNPDEPYVEFENGLVLTLDTHAVPNRRLLFQAQIEETIRQHLRRQAELRPLGVKVLSLFFIDRVASYVDADGLIKTLFDQAFDKLKTLDPELGQYASHQVREGYFAKRKEKSGAEVAIDTAGKNAAERDAEKQAFRLIMRDKERLLSFEEPVCFIFAHSALKEGWDNPNVFQICTLNQTRSPMKKRQEIGRGLRLCVNRDGAREQAPDVNVLTVVANQSYESYASALQQEYVADGDTAPPPPNKAGQATVTRQDAVFDLPEFRAFWHRLSRRARYEIRIDTPRLIDDCVTRLNGLRFPESTIQRTRGRFTITEFRIELVGVEQHGRRARLRVQARDTEGYSSAASGLTPDDGFLVGIDDDLAKKLREPRLKGFQVTEIADDGGNYVVRFGNQVEITCYQPFETSTEKQAARGIAQLIETPIDTRYPVFDLISRTASETMLTRPTVNAIFRGLNDDRRAAIFRNPEGFAGLFISTVRDQTARHVAERIRFVLEPESPPDLPELEVYFPKQEKFAQRELIPSGRRGLYDRVQIDSDLERCFVETRLLEDERNILCYFKFPPRFRIPFPRIIGNYNPDWGIVRRDLKGTPVLELVRETKGTTDLSRLRFAHEPLKIQCAQAFFKVLGISYRVVDCDVPSWWLDDASLTQGPLA